MLLLSHLNACLLYFVPMIQGFPETSWVVTNEIQVRRGVSPLIRYHRIYSDDFILLPSIAVRHLYPLLPQDLAWYEKYIWSFFGAISIMIGIGFGKSEPREIPEVIVTCFIVISGAVGYGVLLANGTALVQNLNYSRTSHEQIVRSFTV